MKKLYLLLLILPLAAGCADNPPVVVADLTVELLSDPQGIDVVAPRFSWKLLADVNDVRQTSYRILVATTPQLLDTGEADVWDSGTVASDRSVLIPYGGGRLESRGRYFWTVQVETNHGPAPRSETARWSMALLDPGDWNADWIGLERVSEENSLEWYTRLAARYFRKEFDLQDKAVERATLYVTGLGFYEASINGRPIGDQVLSPTPTDYTLAVKYNTFDVADLLNGGANAIGVTVGNGRYFSMRLPGVRHFGFPKMIAQLEIEYSDGTRQTVASDTSWKVTDQGPIRSNNEFDGEDYDARMEMPGWDRPGFDDGPWPAAEPVEAPGGKLEAQLNPNMKIMETIKPVAITEPEPGKYILDMGQNMVGWLRATMEGREGAQVTFRFAELVKDDGNLYMDNLRSALVTDRYTFAADGRVTWEPMFTYHGFRYVELTGFDRKPSLDDFEGKVIYDEMEVTGSFETSDPTVNRIYRNAYWGIRGNYRGMPTDCPQRDERMGWLGDRAVGSHGESYIFNNLHLYSKWLDDIEQAQTPEGQVPDVAPNYWHIYTDNMTWPGAYIIIANMLYEQYGDDEPFRKHYGSMKRWLEYMKTRYMVDGIMTKDNFGDWCMPPEAPHLIHSEDPARKTDAAVLGSTFYYHLSRLMENFATVNGNTADADYFAAEAETVKKAFNEKYFDPEKGYYSNNTVTANILPLRFGMVPVEYEEAVFDNIVEKTLGEFDGHVSTGLVGIQQLMRGLSDHGRTDIAWKIATNRTYPSWGYMIENGATTIWELWNGDTADPAMNSANHVMLLGDLLVWFHEYLAGFSNAPGSYGFKEMVFRPHLTEGLDYVDSAFESVHGLIASSWRVTSGRMEWDITIPANTSAKVYVPTGSGGMSDKNREAIVKKGGFYVGSEAGYAIFDFPSGSYSLKSDL